MTDVFDPDSTFPLRIALGPDGRNFGFKNKWSGAAIRARLPEDLGIADGNADLDVALAWVADQALKALLSTLEPRLQRRHEDNQALLRRFRRVAAAMRKALPKDAWMDQTLAAIDKHFNDAAGMPNAPAHWFASGRWPLFLDGKPLRVVEKGRDGKTGRRRDAWKARAQAVLVRVGREAGLTRKLAARIVAAIDRDVRGRARAKKRS